MKACLGKNLKISLPKAYQNKDRSKTLVVKGMPTEFTNDEFKQVLDNNKIKHAKAERMKSKRDGRMLQMFHVELRDPVEADAIISSKITCPQTGIIFKVEEFHAPISVQQCYKGPVIIYGRGGRKNMRGGISIIGFTKGGLDEIHNQPRGASHYYLKLKYGIF